MGVILSCGNKQWVRFINDPSQLCYKQLRAAVVVHTCNLSTWKVEASQGHRNLCFKRPKTKTDRLLWPRQPGVSLAQEPESQPKSLAPHSNTFIAFWYIHQHLFCGHFSLYFSTTSPTAWAPAQLFCVCCTYPNMTKCLINVFEGRIRGGYWENICFLSFPVY